MWFFVLFESLVFTSYFCVYLFFRTQHEKAFLQAQSHLLLGLGVLDTVVLLTSSWAMARSV
ncbi:MAG TPA: cytochrome c oxidase subunit 3 family protein, partial [Candidatus Methylomirabilis sp.]|nr:cytochrome c oxidase subunit 3 family protein [Candidatus Methylomirabilis sp.]